MKKFIITEEERSRILGMHNKTTSRQYLMEAEITYPWLDNTGKPSGAALLANKKADPNFNNWIGIARTKTKEELEKAQKDFNTTPSGPLTKNPDGTQNDEWYQAYLIMKETLKTALTLVGTPEEGTGNAQTATGNAQTATGNAQTATGNAQTATNTKTGSILGDKDYEYKLENGKYYFKGKEGRPSATKYPNWIEAKGKGLQFIKQKVKFQ